MNSNEKTSIVLAFLGVVSGASISFLPSEKMTVLVPVPIALIAMAATSLKQSNDKKDE